MVDFFTDNYFCEKDLSKKLYKQIAVILKQEKQIEKKWELEDRLRKEELEKQARERAELHRQMALRRKQVKMQWVIS